MNDSFEIMLMLIVLSVASPKGVMEECVSLCRVPA